MELFTTLKLKFEEANWSRNPEFALLDAIITENRTLVSHIEKDVIGDNKNNGFGRGDTPSVEQIMRAAIYKELKGLNYRDLEYHQEDSRICAIFLQIDEYESYSFQVYQKYISRITEESLQKLLVEINKIAISQGLESIEKIRQDSTVVETDVHYPTNNSLVWDCIKTSHALLSKLSAELPDFNYRSYLVSAKKTYYKINTTKGKNKEEKVEKLFRQQLTAFTKTINQLSNAAKKKSCCNEIAQAIIQEIEILLPQCQKVYSQTERYQIHGEKVPNSDKIFSIYEPHTDIIVKGSRDTKFGHKVDFTSGAGNLILDCSIPEGNPSDSTLFQPAIKRITTNYDQIPVSIATDGGYAGLANQKFAKDKGIKNIVFNKVTKSLDNIASSKNMETRLKKWRSGIEAVISNIKRRFDLQRVNWKGFGHFKAKVLWSVIAYNIRVMTNHILTQLPVSV